MATSPLRKMAMPRWRFILHGGCAESVPDASRREEILQSLQAVADKTSSALASGTSAREAVVLAVSTLEDYPVFNAGRGAALNRDGIHQLEAGIAEGRPTGSVRYGAVSCVESTKNPIRAANALLDQDQHAMLVGPAADEMARDLGLEQVANSHFTTTFRRTHWQRVVGQGRDVELPEPGTVGAVVLDSHGCLAAGGSTGGPTGKRSGCVGDTAILGAGLYADARVSVLCSGTGDQVFKQLAAAAVARYHAFGSSLIDAARRVLREVSATGAYCALVAIDAAGDAVVESTARVFPVAEGSSSDAAIACLWPNTVPVLAPDEFYNDGHLVVGLSRRPVTRGHALAVIQSGSDLFSLPLDEFVRVLNKVSQAASALSRHYGVKRCALVAEGGSSLALLPLHGLGEEWAPVTSDAIDFHENFPGYISSKDEHHVAFLTPFANTPGFTVLVPRKSPVE